MSIGLSIYQLQNIVFQNHNILSIALSIHNSLKNLDIKISLQRAIYDRGDGHFWLVEGEHFVINYIKLLFDVSYYNLQYKNLPFGRFFLISLQS